MNTLLELITRTKGIEYLLAIAFVFAFVGFWQWQHHRGRGLFVRIAPVAVLSLVFLGMASTCISSPAIATSKVGERAGAGAEDVRDLTNVYGPATATAHSMGPDTISCQTCHHRSPDGQPHACRECHSESVNSQGIDTLGLRAAYHQRCMQCHQGACLGPTTCTNCHPGEGQTSEVKAESPGVVAPPAISHPLSSGYGDCLSCHNPQGLLPLPGNHSSYDVSSTCLKCHSFSAARGTASLVLELSSRPSAPRETPVASTPKSQTAGKITHPLAGRENCLACHGQGAAGTSRLSPGHAGRTNGSCTNCHQAS